MLLNNKRKLTSQPLIVTQNNAKPLKKEKRSNLIQGNILFSRLFKKFTIEFEELTAYSDRSLHS